MSMVVSDRVEIEDLDPALIPEPGNDIVSGRERHDRSEESIDCCGADLRGDVRERPQSESRADQDDSN